MTIDLFNLVVNNKTINIDSDIIIPNEYLENSGIRRLNNIHFKGNIKKLVDDTYSLEGVLSGTMILADDITLEDYEYNFTSEIEENIATITSICYSRIISGWLGSFCWVLGFC